MSIKLEMGKFYRDNKTGEKLMYMGLSWLHGGVHHLFIPYQGEQAMLLEAKTFPHDVDQDTRFSLWDEFHGNIKEKAGYIWAAEGGTPIYIFDHLIEMSTVPKFYESLTEAQSTSFDNYDLYRIQNRCELVKVSRRRQ